MGDGLTFFFDSYALIEIYEKNVNYKDYVNANVITSYFQIYETYYSLIRNGYCEDAVNDFFIFLQDFYIGLKFDWIPKAVEFRREHKKRKLSYADCLGYVIAKEMKIKFLTGDKEFKDLENVEFVEK